MAINNKINSFLVWSIIEAINSQNCGEIASDRKRQTEKAKKKKKQQRKRE